MWSVRTVAVTGPEPVTLAEAKQQCRVDVDDSEDEALISRLAKVAREMVEDRTGLLLRAQTIEITFDGFRDPFRLPRAPVHSITAMTYGDADTTVTGFLFRNRLGVPTLSSGSVWPARTGPVVVTASAGFGADECPERLRHAILMQVADWYERRDSEGTVDAAVDALISDFRLSWL